MPLTLNRDGSYGFLLFCFSQQLSPVADGNKSKSGDHPGGGRRLAF